VNYFRVRRHRPQSLIGPSESPAKDLETSKEHEFQKGYSPQRRRTTPFCHAPHYLLTAAMKKKRRSDKVPALLNVDAEKENPIVPPVNLVTL
jgi:hypothetical protein